MVESSIQSRSIEGRGEVEAWSRQIIWWSAAFCQVAAVLNYSYPLLKSSRLFLRLPNLQGFYNPPKYKMTDSKPSKLPVQVQKPTPYTFDLGLLLANDPNPLVLTTKANLEEDLAATARDGAQALLNQLLSTCPIASTPNGVLLSLPGIETRLPREKVS